MRSWARSVAAGPFDEAFAHDHDPGDASGRDEPAGVGRRDAEGQPTAVNALEHRIRSHGSADRGRCDVGELHLVTDGRGAGGEGAFDCGDGRLLGRLFGPR